MKYMPSSDTHWISWESGVIILQTIHCYETNPAELPYTCTVILRNIENLMILNALTPKSGYDI